METVGQLRTSGIWALAKAWDKVDSDPVLRLEIDVLLQHALGMSRAELITRQDLSIDEGRAKSFYELLKRREQHEPVAYLTGRKEFFGLDFLVDSSVLIPRPETELIVERALEIALTELDRNSPGRLFVVDVGVGSGAILLSVMKTLESLRGHLGDRFLGAVGIDLSEAALTKAKENAANLGINIPLQFLHGDLLTPFRLQESQGGEPIFYLILSNPPYIAEDESLMPDVEKYEPRLALIGGKQGFEIAAELIRQAAVLLAGNQGVLLLEIGQGQADRLLSLPPSRLFDVSRHKDLSGIERVLEFSNRIEHEH